MTIKEIAKLAEVSISTVSKVVNNKAEGINQETIDRVLRIVKEYNYTPYGSVQSQKSSKTFTLGILVKSCVASSSLVAGITRVANQSGYGVVLFESNGNAEQELKSCTALIKRNVDGIIWEPATTTAATTATATTTTTAISPPEAHPSPPAASVAALFAKNSIPVVTIHDSDAAHPELHTYALGYDTLAKLATNTLITLGHRNISFIWDGQGPAFPAAYKSFAETLLEHHIPYTDNMASSQDNFLFESVYNHSCTAILCEGYHTAQWAVAQLERLHIKVPYDVSVLAICDKQYAHPMGQNISCYIAPTGDFGAFLAEKLITRCEQSSTQISHLAEPTHTADPNSQFTFTPAFTGDSSIDIPITDRKPSVVVVGSMNIDVTLNVSELPESGKTLLTDSVITLAGGKGTNQAIGVSKLEKPVALIGKIGTDYESSIALAALEKHNIDTSSILHDSFAKTGMAYIHVQPNGESTITVAGGANSTLTAEEVAGHERLFEHADYCLLQTEVPVPALIAAAELAKKHGVRTILKPASLTRSEARADAKAVGKLFSLVDILIPNAKEARLLSGKDTPKEQAELFMQHGVPVVIITQDKHGAYLAVAPSYGSTGVHGQQSGAVAPHTSRARALGYAKQFPASPKADPVDTTGGADAFIAAFTVYLSLGYSLDKAVQIANIAAGYSVSRFGTFPSMVDKVTLDHYVARMGLE